jgi:hypothetical protein
MKKLFLAAIFFVFALTISAFTTLQAAEIIYVQGVVQVQFAQTDVWKSAEKGMELKKGDAIRTARRSLADLALDEARRNVVRIEPKTLVVLSSDDEGRVDRIDLSQGKLYSSIEGLKAGFGFEVATPSAVTGVRGTGFSVESTKEKDEVAVYEDSVYIKAFDAQKKLLEEMTLSENFKISVERFQSPGELLILSGREIERWDAIKQELYQHAAGADKKTAGAAQDADDQIQQQEETEEKINEIKQSIEDKSPDAAHDLGGHGGY